MAKQNIIICYNKYNNLILSRIMCYNENNNIKYMIYKRIVCTFFLVFRGKNFCH